MSYYPQVQRPHSESWRIEAVIAAVPDGKEGGITVGAVPQHPTVVGTIGGVPGRVLVGGLGLSGQLMAEVVAVLGLGLDGVEAEALVLIMVAVLVAAEALVLEVVEVVVITSLDYLRHVEAMILLISKNLMGQKVKRRNEAFQSFCEYSE